VLAREAVMPRLLGNPRRSVYLSLATHYEAQRRGTTPFTPAVQVAYALDEALAELIEEGLATRHKRYADAAALLRRGFEALGLGFLLPPELRSSSVTSLRLPPGRTYADLHDGLKARGFVIYEGQGRLRQEIFRVANMGHLTRADFEACLRALAEVLRA
jgi:2-aminoethylphosphonate-pyruvate transaminase